MTKMTLTLTQSGLLAALLERQQYKAARLAWRLARGRAFFRQVRSAFLSAFRRCCAVREPSSPETISHSLDSSTS